MTPIAGPQTRAQQLYNESHIRTRISVERLFGTWKRRFPILAYGCRLKLETTLALIPATAVVHNIAIQMNEGEPPVENNIDQLNYLIEMGNIHDIPVNEDNILEGQNVRNELINYFGHL